MSNVHVAASSSRPPTVDQERYLADRDPPVCSLNIKDSFQGLTNQEKLYSHYMSKASWAGGRIIMRQTTASSELLHDLIVETFASSDDPNQLANLDEIKQKSQVSDQDWHDVLSYCAQVLSNLSNFKSFGATKFVPRAPAESFRSIVASSERSKSALARFDRLSDEIYSLTPPSSLSIGFPADGHTSAYYPSEEKPTKREIELVQDVCTKHGLSTLNTRLSKESDTEFTLLVASIDKDDASSPSRVLGDSETQIKVRVRRGDYADCLERVNVALSSASKYVRDDDENRRDMLRLYRESFATGSVDHHKQGSACWVHDVGPVVETYLGFIEDYVDPSGSRAEWEGFVAVVNKEQSKKFNTLVDRASELIKDLPWGKDYEVPEFKRPDFTALEILSFATGGIPAGINIPNYLSVSLFDLTNATTNEPDTKTDHDVREQHGYKNVSLSNILSAKAENEPVTFVAPEEHDAHNAWSDKAFEVQVANHELLGHGTGRLFQENADGTLPFDPSKIVNPLTGEPITSWYKAGENYGSRIGPISSSMEECRAEAVALYLSTNPEILEIFGYRTKEDKDELTYWTFVVMVRAGIRALEWYNPETKKHGQSHMEARLGITNWLISHDLASIEYVRDGSGRLVDAFARVDREAVLARSKDVMGKLLLEIQVRKSTGDREGAERFYKELTRPKDEWVDELRPLVLAKKLPRKIFVQPNTRHIQGRDEVELVEYPVTVEGVIESFVERGL
ncbi:hypothetical protein JCM10212_004694 [Sporobolomyces blumeae]